jgi:hypothetical protein
MMGTGDGTRSRSYKTLSTKMPTCRGGSELPQPLSPPVTLHTDLLDTRCTKLEIHCRFYKKNDKVEIVSKRLNEKET